MSGSTGVWHASFSAIVPEQSGRRSCQGRCPRIKDRWQNQNLINSSPAKPVHFTFDSISTIKQDEHQHPSHHDVTCFAFPRGPAVGRGDTSSSTKCCGEHCLLSGQQGSAERLEIRPSITSPGILQFDSFRSRCYSNGYDNFYDHGRDEWDGRSRGDRDPSEVSSSEL